MKFLLVLLLVTPFVFSAMHPVRQELVDTIKQSATTWTPMNPEENPFFYMPIEKIKAMMGTKLIVDDVIDEDEEDDGLEAPANFDARTAWPGKVHAIRDQGQCGSCWAFGATEALSDRLAISGVDVVLSPQNLVSCDQQNYGCNGGYLNKAWQFMKTTGVVSDSCFPYTSGETGDDGECYTSCQDGSDWKVYKASSVKHTWFPYSTKKFIQKSGPIEAAFTVYEDFMSYSSGVYQHTTGGVLGGHAIKCIGWGVENGTKYWLMANSWGTSWGMEGFFKIKQGDSGVNWQMYGGSA